MNRRQPINRKSSLAGSHVFKVVIAYQDLVGAIRAKIMSEGLADQVKPGIEIACEVWKFDLLRHWDLMEKAVVDAIEADMIIVAARGNAPLPGHVTMWIENWVRQKQNNPAALVALLDQEGRPQDEMPLPCNYLRQIAEEAGMDFFLKTDGWRQAGFRSAVQVFPGRSDNSCADTRSSFSRRPVGRSGMRQSLENEP